MLNIGGEGSKASPGPLEINPATIMKIQFDVLRL